MSVTLTITDHADGTGGTATIAGSSGGSNTVYAATFSGQAGALTWVSVGTRTGDGTVAVTPGNGYYVWVCSSTGGLSNPVWQNLSNASINCPHYQCLVAIQTRLQGLNLPGIGGNVLVKWLPRDLPSVDTLPAILVAPIGREGQPGMLTGKDDIEYPCLVAIVAAANKDYTANLASYLYARWRTFQSLRHQRLAGVPTVLTVSVQPTDVVNPMLFDKNRVFSALTFTCLSRETRG